MCVSMRVCVRVCVCVCVCKILLGHHGKSRGSRASQAIQGKCHCAKVLLDDDPWRLMIYDDEWYVMTDDRC